MQIWQAIVLGFIQGFTEFLPVSSSGHLILAQHFMGIKENVLFYSVLLHIGTLIPVIIVLWKQLIGMFKKPFSKFGFWVLATIPAGIVGLILHFTVDLDKMFAEKIWLLGITFFLTAAELLYTEYRSKKVAMENGINLKTSAMMGIGQGFGVVPGLSRSGTTIAFGSLANVKREENAAFTFIMSVPIIVCAFVLEFITCVKDNAIHDINIGAALLGVLTAMITGYIAIKVMMKVIKKANYKWFSLYLVLMSVLSILAYTIGF